MTGGTIWLFSSASPGPSGTERDPRNCRLSSGNGRTRDLPTEFGKWSSVQALLHKSDNRGFTLRIHALGALHEQAISHALSYDALDQLQRIAAKAGVPADLGRRGHDRARAS